MTTRTLALLLAVGTLAAPAAVFAGGGTIVRLQGSADIEHQDKRTPAAESSNRFPTDWPVRMIAYGPPSITFP